MGKYVCQLCNYIYNEAFGDGIVPCNTPFENLPDDWKCPVCGAGKDKFYLKFEMPQRKKSL